MKRFLAVICSCILTISASHAAPIWQGKLKHNNDDYLLGTIHLGDERFGTLSPAIKQIIDNVDVVVLELNLSKITPEQQQNVTLKYGLLPHGKTLKTELSPEVYQKTAEYLASQGLDIKQFAQFKPWLVGLTIVQLAYAKQGLDPQKGTDQQVFKYAKQQGKTIIGLETFEQQFSFFDQMLADNPQIKNDDLLLDTLTELEKYKDLPTEMVDAWLSADMQSFEKVYKQTLGDTPFDLVAEKVLLIDRNLDWKKQLKPILAQNKTLVAVGTLHFVGENSLIKLLPDPYQIIKP
tara:strand:- start:121 stop:996 length:876 start_codon:yes stop_codon:yes gene_type:complete